MRIKGKQKMSTKIQEMNKNPITRGLAASLSVVASATVFCGVFLTKQDAANAFSLSLAPSSFSATGTLGTVVVVSNPSATPLDTAAAPNGFGSFFTNAGNAPFVSLGGTTLGAGSPPTGGSGVLAIGATPIASSQKRFNSDAASSFILSAADITAATLGGGVEVSFRFAYQGVPNAQNSFNVFVTDALFNPLAEPGFSRTALGDGAASFVLAANLFTAGDEYFVNINLAESNSSGNVAAGFNTFTVAAVPFDFDPSAGIAILGAAYGLNKLRKNLKAKKDTIV
jgi:hypothetical protein